MVLNKILVDWTLRLCITLLFRSPPTLSYPVSRSTCKISLAFPRGTTISSIAILARLKFQYSILFTNLPVNTAWIWYVVVQKRSWWASSTQQFSIWNWRFHSCSAMLAQSLQTQADIMRVVLSKKLKTTVQISSIVVLVQLEPLHNLHSDLMD